jgi:hypothetical protein
MRALAHARAFGYAGKLETEVLAASALCLRRSRDRGADQAWVASDQPFYLAIGFRPVIRHPVWEFAQA